MSQILTKAEKRKRVLEDDDDEEENQERTSEELIQPSVLATKGILKQGDKSSELRKVHFVDEFTFTMSTCSTVSTCSDLGSDGEEDLDLVRRKDSGGAVIQITESRKMTKSEIENLQETSAELECQSIIQSTMDSHSEVDDEVDITQHEPGSELENSEEVQPLVENSELDEFSDSQNQSYLKGGLKDELDGPNFMEGPENGYRDSPERQELKKEETQEEKIFCEQDDSLQQTEFEHSGSELRIVEERKSYEFPNSFTVSDVEVLNNVIRLKIVEYVSCLVYDGDDKQALKDIDLPLLDLLEKSKALPELIKFVQQQYNPSKTLLDIDTSYLIGIVDAVRYTSLLPDLIRKALLDVVQGMTKNKDQLVVYTAVESVKSVYLQETLISAVTDETFLSTLQSHVKIGEDDTGLLGDLQSLVRDNQNCSLC